MDYRTFTAKDAKKRPSDPVIRAGKETAKTLCENFASLCLCGEHFNTQINTQLIF